jgi:alkaline phosphatase D
MTSRRDALKSAALLPLAATPIAARAQPAVSGSPVAGHFTHDSVRLWLQSTADANAVVRYWPEGQGEERAATAKAALFKATQHSDILELKGLAAGTVYQYRVALDGGGTAAGRFRTAPAPGSDPGDFRVYIGSCAYTEAYTRGGNPYGASHHIFDTMAARMGGDALPHFMLWLGDNLYLRGPSPQLGIPSEYETPAHMEVRYRDVRSQLKLRRLFAATHHYAIWDDHDYGPNDSDKSFALKEDSLRLFQAYWPNPPRNAGDPPGTCCRFTHQDAEFFLLDSRFHRDPEKAPPDPAKAMFGPAQMAWLRKGLAESKATFKLVAGGSQFLSESKNGVHSGWHSFAGERDAFLAWLKANPVSGLVLLSGDRHNTQVFREGGVYEYSSSPLTSRLSPLDKAEWANPRLEKDCVVEAHNFGTLEFSGRGASRQVTARAHDADGKLLWTRVLARAG